MSYTAAQLMDAIDKADINRARAIIQQRDQHGYPTVDINKIGHIDYPTAFHYALGIRRGNSNPNFRFEILMELLAARDRQNNPVINLNIHDHNFKNPLDFLLKHSSIETCLSRAHTRALVDAMINLRFNNGERCLDLTVPTHDKILVQAVISDDPVIVQSIIDLRNADGSFAINVNRIFTQNTAHGIPVHYTALDIAHTGAPLEHRPGHVVNPQIIELLLAARARRHADLVPQPEIIPVPVVHPPVMIPVPEARAAARQDHVPPPPVNVPENAVGEVEAFENNPQNIHNRRVEKTVDMAIQGLSHRYPNVDLEKTFDEIRAFISSPEMTKFYNPENLAHVKTGFDFILEPRVSDSIHALSGLRMNFILAMVWAGANDTDPSALPDEQAVATKGYIHLRKMALCDRFKDIATTYLRDGVYREACIGGTRNQIVASLHKAHRDVTISPTRDAANEFALQSVKGWEAEQLKKLDVNTQCAILNSWDTVAEAGPAHDFHYGCQRGMRELLQEKFGALIDQTDIELIVGKDVFHELPKPIVHKQLAALTNKILAFYSQDPVLINMAVPFKHLANKAFLPNQTFDQSCQQLQKHYDRFLLLKQAWKQLTEIYPRPFLTEASNIIEQATQPEIPTLDAYRMIDDHFHDLLELHLLKVRIHALSQSYKGKNTKRTAELSALVEKINLIFNEQPRPVKTLIQELKEALQTTRDRVQTDHLQHGFFGRVNSSLQVKNKAFTKSRTVRLLDQVIAGTAPKI